jgi:hypothetical protein
VGSLNKNKSGTGEDPRKPRKGTRRVPGREDRDPREDPGTDTFGGSFRESLQFSKIGNHVIHINFNFLLE